MRRKDNAVRNLNINSSLKILCSYIESQGFCGYDPYDALTGWSNFKFLGHWAPILAVQFHKRNPINIRPLMGIKRAINPKAAGLLLQAYCILYRKTNDKALIDKIRFLFSWLNENRSPGYKNACWGYPFDWANPEKYLPSFTPTIVATSFVCQGVFEYYLLTKDPSAFQLLQSSCEFIIKNLPRSELPDGICFSYSPYKKDCCYNASLLGAEILARQFSLTQNPELLRLIKESVSFILNHQHEDGHWNYSIDPITGYERAQIDFHQGFILDSLFACKRYAGLELEEIDVAINRGVDFYYNAQFLPDGRSFWRYPKRWPVEIHNQAQGIITFCRFADLNPAYRSFACIIAEWTIQHMQDKLGYFYYQKHQLYTNRISYMRWSQAWMFLALATLITNPGMKD